jgi:hypothetical protein
MFDARRSQALLIWARISSAFAVAAPVRATDGPEKISASEKENLAPAPAEVDVNPVARDEEIRIRLQSVLDATGWFTEPSGARPSAVPG